jgi:hypothetical protein
MNDSGLARGKINQRVGRILHLFKWAVKNELFPTDVYHGLRTVSSLQKGRSAARETEPVITVPESFVAAIKPFVARQVWAMIEPQRLTGMRPGEIALMRKKKRGRKSKQGKATATRRGPSVKEKAHFGFKHRYLIVKRREKFTDAERGDLAEMLRYLPELAVRRRFAYWIYGLFDTPKDLHQARCRRAVLMRDPGFRAIPELAKAMEPLEGEKFGKLMADLKNTANRQVRTNNHVERTNRMFRFPEKVRY